MNYGQTYAPRYNPTQPNYAALAALQHRGLVGAVGDPVTPAKPLTTWQSAMVTLDKPNETVFNIPNKYLLGGAVALGLIGLGWQAGTFDRLAGGKRRK